MSRTYRRKNAEVRTSRYIREYCNGVYLYNITEELNEEFFYNHVRESTQDYIKYIRCVNRDCWTRNGDMGPYERWYSRRFVRKQFAIQKAKFAKYGDEESFYSDKLYKQFAWGV